jgi:hypothetical protein
MPKIHFAICKTPNSNPYSIWTDEAFPYRVPLVKISHQCAVAGCDNSIGSFHSQNGELHITHKCISPCVHAETMRAWMRHFMENVRFTIRLCAVCRREPTKWSTQKWPPPVVFIFASVLIVKVAVHHLWIYVNFAPTNWPIRKYIPYIYSSTISIVITPFSHTLQIFRPRQMGMQSTKYNPQIPCVAIQPITQNSRTPSRHIHARHADSN